MSINLLFQSKRTSSSFFMQTISESHPQSAWLFACSKTIERGAYYGFRGLVVLFMIDILGMPTEGALQIYGWFAGALVFSHLLGGLLGDLMIGNRTASLIGGVLLAIGTFVFCTLSHSGLYIGLVLIVIGDALYSPNLTAQFGKLYLSKLRLLDAGFMLFYVGINIGVGLGVFLIASIGGETYWPGFLTAGVLHLLAVGILALIPQPTPETPVEQPAIAPTKPAYKTDLAPLFILGTCLIVALFWGIYEFAGGAMFSINYALDESSTFSFMGIGWSQWSQSLNPIIIILMGFLSAAVWSFFYGNRMLKLSIGLLLASISFAILIPLPASPTDAHLPQVVISVILLAISEIYIAPLLYSILTEYGDPNLLATLIGLSVFLIRLVSLLTGAFILGIFDGMPAVMFGISAGILGGVGLLLGVLFLANPKSDSIKEI